MSDTEKSFVCRSSLRVLRCVFVISLLGPFAALADEASGGQTGNGEHDFGEFEHAGVRVLWKIDYYDRDGEEFGSPDPSDPEESGC